MEINTSIGLLKRYIERENFGGYDPYDALCSPILQRFSFNRYMRIGFIQFFKKTPINLRPILAIKKDYNPKALGLFLGGHAKLCGIEKRSEYLEKINKFLDLLDSLKSRGYSGNCWGYNFNWQSRAFYLPKYTPTIVNSSFIGHALIDTYRITKIDRALEMAVSINKFILSDLNRKKENSGGICFSYSPYNNTFVHNANLLGSSFIIRIYHYINDPTLKEIALESLSYTMKYQQEDGSWYYAETDFQKWIDSFHTGFNLQSILYFLEEGFGTKYKEAFDKGVNFYISNFFLEDGTPKYYHNKLYPIDIHSAAQAVVFFSQNGNRDMAEKVLKWMIDNMQDKKGYFYYQKRRFYVNKIPYMRWNQAWAFNALTSYMYYHG